MHSISERENVHTDEDILVTLTVGQLRAIIRSELITVLDLQNAEPLLTIEEAALRLAVSPDWLYRKAGKLPFTRKLGPKMLRFSPVGLAKWLRTRTPP